MLTVDSCFWSLSDINICPESVIYFSYFGTVDLKLIDYWINSSKSKFKEVLIWPSSPPPPPHHHEWRLKLIWFTFTNPMFDNWFKPQESFKIMLKNCPTEADWTQKLQQWPPLAVIILFWCIGIISLKLKRTSD